MSFDVKLSITGIQEAMRENLKDINDLRPGGGFSRVIFDTLTGVHRQAVIATHKDTGALKASHRIKFDGGFYGEIFIDPASRNPRSGTPPAEYGVYEHARGGGHAFYDIAAAQAPKIVSRAISQWPT